MYKSTGPLNLVITSDPNIRFDMLQHITGVLSLIYFVFIDSKMCLENPFIHFLSMLTVHSGSRGGWSLSELSWGERGAYHGHVTSSPQGHHRDNCPHSQVQKMSFLIAAIHIWARKIRIQHI